MSLRAPNEVPRMDTSSINPAMQMKDTRQDAEKRFDESRFGQFVGKYFSFLRDGTRSMWGLEVYNPDLYSPETLAKINNDKTSWERVKAVFIPDPQDSEIATGQMLAAAEVCGMGVLGGAGYGILVGVRGIRERFIQMHQATIFERPSEARSRLVDTLVFHGARSGFKYGVKVGVLAGIFSLSVGVITAWRNRSGILEYTCSGFLMGAVWRSNMGLSGAFVGGLLGGLLGTLGGSFSYATQRLSHRTYEELTYWNRMRQKKVYQDGKSAHPNNPESIEDGPIRMHDVFGQANLLDDLAVKKPGVYPAVNLPDEHSEQLTVKTSNQ